MNRVRGGIHYSKYDSSSSIYEDDSDKPNGDALKLAVRMFVFSSYRIFKKFVDENVDLSSIFAGSKLLRE